MKRRTVLGATGTAVLATFAGCWGLAEAVDGDLSLPGGRDGSADESGPDDGSDDPTSEGDDDESIDAPTEELLLSAEDLGEAWERGTIGKEECRKFSRHVSDGEGEKRVTSCAWVYEATAEAEEEYATKVERSRKLDGELMDEEPNVGVEAAAIRGGRRSPGIQYTVLFRDANAVGSIEFEFLSLDTVPSSEIPQSPEVFGHAATMHGKWRE